MRIATGTPIGPYLIVSHLGTGESGDVYRARDLRLGRDVALKLLSPELAEDRERLRRFEQESHAVAALNHPGILSIYDVGSWQRTRYLVSELLHGQTLRQLLTAHGALPVHKAIEIARIIADALADAHDHGIVHRDLKPENLFLTHDGRVKILDFGLARQIRRRSVSVAGGDSETMLESGFSEAGMLLGTVGYMAPEQVRGEDVDGRADLFSLGAILYEMISGRRAFSGDSAIETLHAILKQEPEPLTSPRGPLPHGLAALVDHCLEKNPEHRFQNARDLCFALNTLTAVAASPETPPAAGRQRKWALLLATALMLAMATGAWFSLRQPGERSDSVGRFVPLTFRQGTIVSARFAPDNQSIVYGAEWEGAPGQLFITRSDSPESRALDINGSIAAISSTGRMALLLGCERVFVLDCHGTLAEMPLGGGAPRKIMDEVIAADWSPDGKALAVVHWNGSAVELQYPLGHPLATTPSWFGNPRISPSGHSIAYAHHSVLGSDSGDVMVVDVRTGEKRVLSSGWSALEGLAWRPDGREIWFAAGKGGVSDTIYAVTLQGKLRIVDPLPGMFRLEDIAPNGDMLVDQVSFRVGISGQFPGATRERPMSWLDASVVTDITPDGRAILFFEGGQGGGSLGSTYLRTTDGSPPVRLGDGVSHALSPNGKWALSQLPAEPSNLMLLPTGVGDARVLVPNLQSGHGEVGWFPDSEHIYYPSGYPSAQRYYKLDLHGDKPVPITPVVARGGLPTPDGNWFLALASDQHWYFYSVNAAAPPRRAPGLNADDTPLTWSSDGESLFVRAKDVWPAVIVRVRMKDGQRKAWQQIQPQDRAGVSSMNDLVLTPDGRHYAYSYHRTLSQMYLVRGLR